MSYKAKKTASGFTISTGNSKMGKVSSISVSPVTTCPKDAPCYRLCYAGKMTRIYPTVKRSYEKNTKLLMEEHKYPQLEEDVVGYIKTDGVKYFRWNVSGDIFSEEYLQSIRSIAEKCPDTKFWLFTKQYRILEDYSSKLRGLGMWYPKNLTIILSVWGGYKPNELLMKDFGVNHFGDKEGLCVIPTDAFVCKGDCEHCLKCSTLNAGESIVIYQH